MTLTVSGKELEGVYQPTQNPCPSVEEAIGKMKVPEGYEVRNFAAEPMVVNPVAMSWDGRGRLWVVELYEYPSGAKETNEYQKAAGDGKYRPVVKMGPSSPRDRVVVLEDTDNDGKADKRTVFAEGLSLATAVLCGHGGVYVGQAPNLFFFRDTDGDDKADEYKAVLTGFGLEDRHELLNSFMWGPDGMMYFTHGVFTNSKVRRPGEKDDAGNVLNAGIYRVKLTATGDAAADPVVAFHEVYTDGTSNPWGVDFDAQGNAFVEACVIDHLFHMAPGGIYARQGGAPENPYAYELLPSIVQPDQPKHFRAAYAGIQIYQGGVYPGDTAGHAFFGNIHDNAIHEEALEPAGAGFKARPVRDFLRANDGWFRPVSIQTGPDGVLWVMDWCDKYPCYQNAQANPAGVDREKGRIWRVCYTGNEAGKRLAGVSREDKGLDVSKASPGELVAMMGHRNNWVARQAVVRSVQAPMSSALEAELGKALGTADAVLGDRLAAALSFGGMGDVRSGGGYALAKHVLDGRVSAGWGARLVGGKGAGFVKPGLWSADLLNELARHPMPAVRYEVAMALRRLVTGAYTVGGEAAIDEELSLGILGTLIGASLKEDDRLVRFAIWEAFEPILARRPELVNVVMLAGPGEVQLARTLTYKAARRLTDTRRAENMDLLLGYLEKIKGDDVLTAHALDGMLKAQEAGALKPLKHDPAALFAVWRASKAEGVRSLAGRLGTLWGDPNAVAALMGVVLDEKADVVKRIEAIRTVRRLKSDAARAGLLQVLGQRSPEVVTVETLRAAGELGGMDLANGILKAWGEYPASVKTAAAEVLASRADWSERLLDAVAGNSVESGRVNPSDIPVSVRRSFAQSEKLKDRAQRLLGAWNESGDDVRALVAAKKKACLTGEPDLAKGKLIFAATCATCHKFHGGGQEVGPELIGSGRSNLDAILANVIDPNQIIGNGYENFLVTTADGRTVAGRVLEDTPTQMTLLGIGGVETVVPRSEIKEVKNTHQSLMPMGFGQLPDDQFRDLIWYVLAPPEEGVLSAEKKAALVLSADGREAVVVPPSDGTDLWDAKRRDRESASLWNVDWKIEGADFEGAPTKLVEYRGRKNVLVLHPPGRKEAAALVRTLELPADKAVKLSVWVASHDGGDWELRASADGKRLGDGVKVANEGKERWKRVEFDLGAYRGKRVELRLENWPTGWLNEFSFWSELKIE